VDDHGGVTVVQDPSDALHPGMPGSAIEEAEPHHVLPAAEIADLIVRLAEQPVPFPFRAIRPAEAAEPAGGEPANMSCPECGGPLSERREGRMPFYACRVGHTFSTASLFAEQADAFESALWTAIRVLKEREDLALRLAERLERRGGDMASQRFRRTAEETRRQFETLRTLVEDFDAAAEAGPRGADIASAAQGRTVGQR
jgi:two-component system chemotaxis response regulator CheB